MGIINQADQSSVKTNSGPEDSNKVEYRMTIEACSPSPIPSEFAVPASPAKASMRRNNRGHPRYNPVRDYPSGQYRRNGGARRIRRSENMNFLLGLAEIEDDVENLADLVEPTVTAFSQLFMEHDKMKVWNDFINRTEEDQEMLLHTNSQKQETACPSQANSVEDDITDGDDLDDSWEDLGKDLRKVHPGYTADMCFKRIDNKLKTFLQRRQVPKGTLEYLEADVTAFFLEWPSSILVSKPASSFERLMLHALCQYLDLSSHSFDGNNGERQTEVENKNAFFKPPEVTLTQFLEAKD